METRQKNTTLSFIFKKKSEKRRGVEFSTSKSQDCAKMLANRKFDLLNFAVITIKKWKYAKFRNLLILPCCRLLKAAVNDQLNRLNCFRFLSGVLSEGSWWKIYNIQNSQVIAQDFVVIAVRCYTLKPLSLI